MKIVAIKKPPPVEQLIECFARRRLSFALDSAQSNDGLGEWSFFGADPFAVISGKDGSYVQSSQLGASWQSRRSDDGLAVLREAMAACGAPQDLFSPAAEEASPSLPEIPFRGGAVGFLAYDYGRQIERLPATAVDDRGIPDLHFGLYDGVAALHHASGRLYLIALGIRGPEGSVLEELQAIIETAAPGGAASDFSRKYAVVSVLAPASAPHHSNPTGSRKKHHVEITAAASREEDASARVGEWQWNRSPEEFCESVRRIRDYIASGDVYQVNLSRRARAAFEGDPVRLYHALRAGNPAPYGAYLDVGDLKILSTSPEQFLRKRGRVLETRPIKGTRPRGDDPEADAANAEALRLSAKDRAELLMIVDLERNDLGRVAEFGSVAVAGMYHQERYARVIHQTARVQAQLAAGRDVFDAIRALFPGGSITGAPKVRAMELIEALEPTRRGVYCGSMGYIGFDGDAELNIAIRSLHLKNGMLDYQVGSGIVWDSDPEVEYQETMDKGRAIREAIATICPKSQ